KLCAKLIEDNYPSDRWNIYPFHFSDGDNWSVDDTHTCVDLLKKDVLPYVNLFCYGQVESPYGSGQFIKDLTEHFDEDEWVVTSEIKGKEAIMDSIKEFLGKGKYPGRSSDARRTCAISRKRSKATPATTVSTSSRSSTRSSTTRR